MEFGFGSRETDAIARKQQRASGAVEGLDGLPDLIPEMRVVEGCGDLRDIEAV